MPMPMLMPMLTLVLMRVDIDGMARLSFFGRAIEASWRGYGCLVPWGRRSEGRKVGAGAGAGADQLIARIADRGEGGMLLWSLSVCLDLEAAVAMSVGVFHRWYGMGMGG